MKRPSEAAFGAALRAVDASVPTYVYRLPDPKGGAGVSNPKPCDFMVWTLAETAMLGSDNLPLKLVDAAWFEVKDVDAVHTFNLKNEMRSSQMQGIRTAARIGIPYWIAVWWRRHNDWTISDGVRILTAGVDDIVSRNLLMTRYGISSDARSLTSVLKSVLAQEL